MLLTRSCFTTTEEQIRTTDLEEALVGASAQMSMVSPTDPHYPLMLNLHELAARMYQVLLGVAQEAQSRESDAVPN